MKLKLVLDMDSNTTSPILKSALIALAEKHKVHAILSFFDVNSDKIKELPFNAYYPEDLYFALDEDDAQLIEQVWSHAGNVFRIYSRTAE